MSSELGACLWVQPSPQHTHSPGLPQGPRDAEPSTRPVGGPAGGVLAVPQAASGAVPLGQGAGRDAILGCRANQPHLGEPPGSSCRSGLKPLPPHAAGLLRGIGTAWDLHAP